MSAPLLEVNDLKKHFRVRGGFLGRAPAWVYAVDGVSFEIARGETLSLVGESGCGKPTVGRAILRLFDITSGQVVLDGQRIDDLSAGALRPIRRRVQVVFQDPFSSLNPRMRVKDIVAEPIRNFGLAKSASDLDAQVAALMDKVRLPREAAERRIFAAPRHPYTQALLSAVPVPEPGANRQRIILKGDVPSPINPPKGCRFHTRCPYAFDRCRVEEPKLQPTEAGHLAACHLLDAPAVAAA